jgi:hypothetical protein
MKPLCPTQTSLLRSAASLPRYGTAACQRPELCLDRAGERVSVVTEQFALEQMRSIFDEGMAGMLLIGMPGVEERIARLPQFYFRIGFVHEFRPLYSTGMQNCKNDTGARRRDAAGGTFRTRGHGAADQYATSGCSLGCLPDRTGPKSKQSPAYSVRCS